MMAWNMMTGTIKRLHQLFHNPSTVLSQIPIDASKMTNNLPVRTKALPANYRSGTLNGRSFWKRKTASQTSFENKPCKMLERNSPDNSD